MFPLTCMKFHTTLILNEQGKGIKNCKWTQGRCPQLHRENDARGRHKPGRTCKADGCGKNQYQQDIEAKSFGNTGLSNKNGRALEFRDRDKDQEEINLSHGDCK